MLSLGRALADRLSRQADDAVRGVLAGTTGMAAPADAREALGATVSTGLPLAADAWGQFLGSAGITPRLVGAFSFGAPMVEFCADGQVRRCAIADVLLVVDDLTGAAPDRRAMILRAGLAVANDTLPSAPQQALDAGWPQFRFMEPVGRGDAPPVRRLGDGAGFAGRMAVDLAPGVRAWRVHRAAGRAASRGLGRLLVEMAQGRAGRAAKTAVPDDDWSRTVDDLLRRTANATFDGLGRHPRLRSVMTHQGARGTGFVIFENRTDLDIARALAGGRGGGVTAEGPLSVVHTTFGRT